MGVFKKPKIETIAQPVETTEKKEESMAKKQRLTLTEGEQLGQTLNASQTKNIRKIFG